MIIHLKDLPFIQIGRGTFKNNNIHYSLNYKIISLNKFTLLSILYKKKKMSILYKIIINTRKIICSFDLS